VLGVLGGAGRHCEYGFFSGLVDEEEKRKRWKVKDNDDDDEVARGAAQECAGGRGRIHPGPRLDKVGWGRRLRLSRSAEWGVGAARETLSGDERTADHRRKRNVNRPLDRWLT
jgi:hypothetical protein